VDQPVSRTLPTHRTTQTQTSMPIVGSEPTIPVFKRAKTGHALDRTTTVIGKPDELDYIL
jgi:muramoyltetrapeptide carboxypeptidase LdcA involved in peptidoglycan recycling